MTQNYWDMQIIECMAAVEVLCGCSHSSKCQEYAMGYMGPWSKDQLIPRAKISSSLI